MTVVLPGDGFAARDGWTFTIDCGRRSDYEALFERLADENRLPQNILHLWCVGEPEADLSELELLDYWQLRGFYSLLYTVQALVTRNVAKPVQLVAASTGLQAVTGDERICPAKAMLLGLCRTVPQEYPHIACRSVDVERPDEDGRDADDVAARARGGVRRRRAASDGRVPKRAALAAGVRAAATRRDAAGVLAGPVARRLHDHRRARPHRPRAGGRARPPRPRSPRARGPLRSPRSRGLGRLAREPRGGRPAERHHSAPARPRGRGRRAATPAGGRRRPRAGSCRGRRDVRALRTARRSHPRRRERHAGGLLQPRRGGSRSLRSGSSRRRSAA